MCLLSQEAAKIQVFFCWVSVLGELSRSPITNRAGGSADLVNLFVNQPIGLNPRHHAAQTLADFFNGML